MTQTGFLAALAMARDACAAMSEPQRIAFAIEQINKLEDDRNAFHVIRLGSVCSDIGGAMMKRSFERECG